MERQNARLLIGEKKAVLTEVSFKGAYSPLDCNGTITVPKDCGFLPTMFDGPVYLDGGGMVYRISRTWDTRLKGDEYVIRCSGESESNLEAFLEPLNTGAV